LRKSLAWYVCIEKQVGKSNPNYLQQITMTLKVVQFSKVDLTLDIKFSGVRAGVDSNFYYVIWKNG